MHLSQPQPKVSLALLKLFLRQDILFLGIASEDVKKFLTLTLSFIYTHLTHRRKKNFRKTLWKKVKLLKMSNVTFSHNVFYAICILKSFISHISVVVCSVFEFGTVSKWCTREWVKRNFLPHASEPLPMV